MAQQAQEQEQEEAPEAAMDATGAIADEAASGEVGAQEVAVPGDDGRHGDGHDGDAAADGDAAPREEAPAEEAARPSSRPQSDKRARRRSAAKGAKRAARKEASEYVAVLELALELSDRTERLVMVRRVFDCLLGMRFNPCWQPSKSGAGAKMDKLQAELEAHADKESSEPKTLAESLGSPCLSDICWAYLRGSTVLADAAPRLVSEWKDMTALASNIFDTLVRNPRVDLEHVLDDKKSEEYLNCVVLMDSYASMFTRWFGVLRPCLANVETFLEQRRPMVEMVDLEVGPVLKCLDAAQCARIERDLVRARRVGAVEAIQEANRTDLAQESTRPAASAGNQEGEKETRAEMERLRGSQDDRHLVFDGLEASIAAGLEKDSRNGGFGGGANVLSHLVTRNMSRQRRQPNTLRVVRRPYDSEALLGSNHARVVQYARKRTMTLLWVNELLDHYLATLSASLLWLGFAELLQHSDLAADALASFHTLAANLVRTGLPLIERVLDFEPQLLEFNIVNLTTRKLGSPDRVDSGMYGIVHKMRVLHHALSALDVHVFPRTIHVHLGTVRTVALSNLDPELVLTCGDDRLMRIWNTRTGACLALFAGHKSIVTWCAFTPNDQYIVSASFDTSVKVWDSRTGRCRCTLNGHTDSIVDGDLSPNGKLILTASMDGTVRLWSLTSSNCFRVFRGHRSDSWVKSVAFLADGTGFVSGGLDGRVVVWSLAAPPPPEKPDAEPTPLRPEHVWTDLHSSYVLDLAVLGAEQSPTRTPLLLTISKDATQNLVNLGTLSVHQALYARSTAKNGSSWANSCCFSSDGRLFALASFSNSLRVHATHSGALLRQIRVHNDGISRVRFSADARFLFVGTSSGRLQLIPL